MGPHRISGLEAADSVERMRQIKGCLLECIFMLLCLCDAGAVVHHCCCASLAVWNHPASAEVSAGIKQTSAFMNLLLTANSLPHPSVSTSAQLILITLITVVIWA
jgi:hypothetical protein